MPCVLHGRALRHYMGNIGFPLAPHPYYELLGDDIGLLASEGASGYFAQGATGGGADMSELVSYLIGRKTVDPGANTSELVRGFVSGFYGDEAAPHVHNYLHLMSTAAMTYGATGALCQAESCPDLSAGRDFSPSSVFFANETVVATATAMWNAAKAVAALPAPGSAGKQQQADYALRVARSSLSINYIVLLRWEMYYDWVTATQGKAWPLATADKRQFFETQFAPIYNLSVTEIAVPTCNEWTNGPGPSGHQCWNKAGNLSEFENYLFPSAPPL